MEAASRAAISGITFVERVLQSSDEFTSEIVKRRLLAKMNWLNIDWQAVEATSTVIGVILVGLAGFWTIQQFRETKRARNAQLVFPLFSELRNEEMKERLRKIYKLPTSEVPSDMENDVSYVLDRLEWLLHN